MITSDNHHFGEIVKIIKAEVARWREPVVSEVKRRTNDPFRILISCILSLRTKDDQTRQASARLFGLAINPSRMLQLSEERIAKTIYPVGFYNNKAKAIRQICRELIERFGGKVPDTLEDLLSLKGVGRKTANLVLTIGFDKYGICVDTHVHRISNRLGWVSTKTPEKTEMALRQILPRRYWKIINDLLVTYGQNLCTPVSPFCSRCKIAKYCKRTGVKHRR